MDTQELEQCPLDECYIREVHGHGTDRTFLGRQGPKPGSLESLLEQAFTAGVDRGAWGEHGEGDAPPNFEEWRQSLVGGE